MHPQATGISSAHASEDALPPYIPARGDAGKPVEPKLSTPKRIPLFIAPIFILVPVFIAAIIAHNSVNFAHPDEDVHMDSFKWFQSHWTMPEMSSPELRYSSMGWSRVYSGEIVYLIYGKLGSLIVPPVPTDDEPIITTPSRYERWATTIEPRFQKLSHATFEKFTKAIESKSPDTEEPPPPRTEPEEGPPDPVHIYRYFNVTLLFLTLTAIFLTRCRWFNPGYLALLLIGIPQVVYIYAYANSDAWALTWTILLFLQTANLLDHPPREWRWYRMAMLMFSALMLVLSKQDFSLGFVLPAILLIVHFIRYRRQSPSIFWFATRLVVPAAVVWILAGLWNPNYGLHRSEWKAKILEMREERAQPGKSPSTATDNYYMASQGYTYRDLMHWKGDRWLPRNLESFYSRFGGWTVKHDPKFFDYPWKIGAVAFLLTMIAQFLFRRRMSIYLAVSLLLAPILIAINFLGSMWYSLNVDFQPQGRYLFPCLISIFFLFAGTIGIEKWWYRWAHILVFAPLIALSMYILLYYGAWEPTLQGNPYWSGG